MDPFLLCLILCCLAAVALEWAKLLDSGWLAFGGLALLADIAVIVIASGG